MIVRVLFLILAFFILINLCILALCQMTEKNLYKLYGKQMLFVLGFLVLMVVALYVALALIGLK